MQICSFLWIYYGYPASTYEGINTEAARNRCGQALALVPGTSRSGATIIGAMLFGLSRTAATEFSFFLAIPTLGAAFAHQLERLTDF